MKTSSAKRLGAVRALLREEMEHGLLSLPDGLELDADPSEAELDVVGPEATV